MWLHVDENLYKNPGNPDASSFKPVMEFAMDVEDALSNLLQLHGHDAIESHHRAAIDELRQEAYACRKTNPDAA